MILLIMWLCFIPGCMPPPGNDEVGYTIHGYVGKSTTEAAPGKTVMLLDGNTDQPLASKQANFMGKYKFSGLKPGYYKIKVDDKLLDVVISNKNQRIDIDLSAEDGSMNYAAGAIKDYLNEVAAKGKPGGDTLLAKRFMGKWYGFSGAAGGGGSESQMAFCANGAYYESYEAGYSGSSSDQYGNETSAFGSASQESGDGHWSIEGTVEQGRITIKYSNGNTSVIEYVRDQKDQQCYYFDGRLHCYNGACD